MADPNRAMFESVVRLLAPVLDELVFVGGCTTGVFITDPAAGGIRPTKDVDAIVDVTSDAEYAVLSERLRALGLAEDSTPGAPLCRWRRNDLIVDVMPVDAHVLGFSNRWYRAAIDGGWLTLNVHFHALILDGVFERRADGSLVSHPARRLAPTDVDEVLATVEALVARRRQTRTTCPDTADS